MAIIFQLTLLLNVLFMFLCIIISFIYFVKAILINREFLIHISRTRPEVGDISIKSGFWFNYPSAKNLKPYFLIYSEVPQDDEKSKFYKKKFRKFLITGVLILLVGLFSVLMIPVLLIFIDFILQGLVLLTKGI